MHKLSTLARAVQLLVLVSIGVCVGNLQAQSQEFATVIELQGQVSVIRGDLRPLYAKGTPGAPAGLTGVKAKEEIVTGADGHAVFQTSDGSTFEVFPNSRLTFQGDWTIQDMLQLILGKIRVQIEHRNGPNHKRISTPTAVISVRGTTFDVAVEDEDGTTYVGVEEGQVLVQHRLQPGPLKTLNQNEWLRIYANQPLAKAGNPSKGAWAFVWNRVRNALGDLVLNNPGGVIGGVPGSPGGPQGDAGKGKKNPPTTAPPPTPGGGN
jgi:hypothetical protein